MRSSPGAALAVLGAGVAAVGTFGLVLEDRSSYSFSNYAVYHEFASDFGGRAADRVFGSWRWWWSWGQVTVGAVTLLLVAALVLVAHRTAARVIAILAMLAAVAYGTLALLTWVNTPTYTALQQYAFARDSVLGNATTGVWVGLAGVVVLVLGALVAAIAPAGDRPTTPPAGYPPPPPPPVVPQPSSPPGPPDRPTTKHL